MNEMYAGYSKPMSEVPQSIFVTLYNLRLYEDFNKPYEEYIKMYKMISIDNVIYYSPDCEEWRIKNCLSTFSTFKKTSLTDAVINGFFVKKNRYGHDSFHMYNSR